MRHRRRDTEPSVLDVAELSGDTVEAQALLQSLNGGGRADLQSRALGRGDDPDEAGVSLRAAAASVRLHARAFEVCELVDVPFWTRNSQRQQKSRP